MGLFDKLVGNKSHSPIKQAINYGKNKSDGSHDHRTNIGNDRTPAQKAADEKKRKS